jgi:hypothetical protein
MYSAEDRKELKETAPVLEQSFERLKSVSVAEISSSAVRLELVANVHGIKLIITFILSELSEHEDCLTARL